MFDAVIFDLDGTLIDSEALTQAAGVEAFAEFGIDVDPAFLHRMIGVDDRTSARLFRTTFPGLDPEAFDQVMATAVRQRYRQGVPLKPGTTELLALIRQPKAIVTSSTRVQVDYKLGLIGLGVHFAHVVSVDDVSAPKPAPEPYLLAATLLGVDPARCLVFEDSETGARSAHAAGMTVVQVPDILPATGDFAHVVAADLLSGARAVGLIEA